MSDKKNVAATLFENFISTNEKTNKLNYSKKGNLFIFHIRLMHKKPVAAAKTTHEMLRFSCFEKRGFTFHERVLVSMIMILSYTS